MTADTKQPQPVQPGESVSILPVYFREEGPFLAQGLLNASLRKAWAGRPAAPNIRLPCEAEEAAELLAGTDEPIILFISEYIWSAGANASFVARARRLHDRLWILRGGPHIPSRSADVLAFYGDPANRGDVLVVGEGEVTCCELVEAFCADGTFIAERLADIDGIVYFDGEPKTTPTRDRITDLDALPSPYLTGEFDHVPAEAWPTLLPIEGSRGCPYGCTFCDWGSSTMSRIRWFDPERVEAEVRWAAERGIGCIQLTDGNFGISRRDVDVAHRVANVYREFGAPGSVVYANAKNTTKHLASIAQEFNSAGIVPAVALALQTADPTTLEAIDRENISTPRFMALAAEYRRQDIRIPGDLMIGLPGQTYRSFLDDLQMFIDLRGVPSGVADPGAAKLAHGCPRVHRTLWRDHRRSRCGAGNRHRVARDAHPNASHERPGRNLRAFAGGSPLLALCAVGTWNPGYRRAGTTPPGDRRSA